MNLAMEEALLRVRLENSKNNILWFWVNKPSVILGCFSRLDEVNLSECGNLEIPILRRISGGGAVYHDLGNLNYTVIAHVGKNGLPTDTVKAYKFISECLLAGLNHLNIPQLSFLSPNTILLNGRKVGGMAQHLLYNVTLVHGTLLVNSNLELMNKLIKMKFPVINLSEVKDLSLKEVKEALLEGFKTKFQPVFTDAFTQNELKLAEKLCKIKYNRRWWIFRSS